MPQLAGTPPGRDGVDPSEARRHRDSHERAEGVPSVAQPLQGSLDVARCRHAQTRRLLGHAL